MGLHCTRTQNKDFRDRQRSVTVRNEYILIVRECAHINKTRVYASNEFIKLNEACEIIILHKNKLKLV